MIYLRKFWPFWVIAQNFRLKRENRIDFFLSYTLFDSFNIFRQKLNIGNFFLYKIIQRLKLTTGGYKVNQRKVE